MNNISFEIMNILSCLCLGFIFTRSESIRKDDRIYLFIEICLAFEKSDRI